MASVSDLLFQFHGYKEYLVAVEQRKLVAQKGFRSKLAVAAGCNTPFVSHVLNGQAHFSLEQGIGISQFLGHGEDDQQYFLLLLQFDRAGSVALRTFFSQQIAARSEHHQNLKTRLKTRDKLRLEDKVRYYSAWDYAAIHVIITIESFQKVHEISKRLHLPESRVVLVLGHLQEMGLVDFVDGLYQANNKQIYLGHDSDLISKHHHNWRIRALSSIAAMNDQDLHYSSAITISAADAKKMRRLLVDFIAQVTPIINESKEEEIFSLCMDFYKL